MNRLCVFGVVFTILFTDGVNSNPITNVQLDEGSSYGIFVTTIGHNVTKCNLETPHDEVITFAPGDETKFTDKYLVTQGVTGMAECSIAIKNIDKHDEGIWVMSYDHDEGAGRTERFNIKVNVAEPEESEEEEEDNVRLLTTINHYTRIEQLIDISLPRESFDHECYIRPPNGELIKADDFKMENVTVQSRSIYVSCRITIGPMSADLLGTWRLCAKPTGEDQMTCQPVNIAWNNNNPNIAWDSITQPRFKHPVHIGGSVNPGVAGRGDVLTCHVITPDGEDLVIKPDVKYPHIERIALNSASLCSIKFTDIDKNLIGDWTIYGKFRAFSVGLNEVHLPLNFFIYDDTDPYKQAYNVTVLPEERHLVNLGTLLDITVKYFGQVDECFYRTPSGETYDLNDANTIQGVVFKTLDTDVACQLSLDPITEEMLGEWQIVGKFSNGNQFSERQQTFQIIQEDPSNPIIDEHRVIENLSEVFLDTQMGASHRLTISSVGFVENESCHLVTPNGLQYAFILGFNIPNVEIIRENGVECGVVINVNTEDIIGEWTLIARANRLSTPIERRRSFTIRVEETLSIGNPVTISEGADLYLRLPDATNFYDTCKLYGPDGEEITNFEVDPLHPLACGYIVRGVTRSQHGTWAIVYGNQIIYRATLQVNILASVENSLEDLSWTVGSAVNKSIGPEDAVYCKIEDAKTTTVFDGFGACRIVVDRVTKDHEGVWKVSIAVAGTVLLEDRTFFVKVREADSRPTVTTSVSKNGPSVMLTCSVPVHFKVEACKFRDPQNNILIASHGVGQDGYTFEGAVVSYESDAHSHDCTLRLINPSPLHQGTWRCAVNTKQGIYYGFITYVNELDAAVLDTDPILRSERETIFSSEGEAVTMSCTIDTPIRYCYFRAQNGTVYNVGPAISSSGYEYIGRGFDAGDCGVRFNSLVATDGGRWSCHVGLEDSGAVEQRASFNVQVDELMWVGHTWEVNTVVVRGAMERRVPLDYCRFVRIDGFGFTSDNVPSEYWIDTSNIPFGACTLRIYSPTRLDLHPWTVVVKVTGEDGEISRSTGNRLLIPRVRGMPLMSAILLWMSFGVLCLLLLTSAIALIPKKNREWTYERASHIRNSFRRRPQTINTIVADLPPKV